MVVFTAFMQVKIQIKNLYYNTTSGLINVYDCAKPENHVKLFEENGFHMILKPLKHRGLSHAARFVFGNI